MFVEPRRIGRTCSLFDAFAPLGHGGSSEAECTSSNGQPAPPASTQQLATHAIDEVALVSDIDSRLLTDRGQNRTCKGVHLVALGTAPAVAVLASGQVKATTWRR